MGESMLMIGASLASILICFAFLCWVLIFRPRHIKKLHDEVVDTTTSSVLEACLAYGQSQLSYGQYEKFKALLTAEITEGEGGISLAKLVERCITEAQEEVA